jgi:hypothetical protein
MICSGMPSIWICSRSTSRVVPAMSVTIAASRPMKKLISSPTAKLKPS